MSALDTFIFQNSIFCPVCGKEYNRVYSKEFSIESVNYVVGDDLRDGVDFPYKIKNCVVKCFFCNCKSSPSIYILVEQYIYKGCFLKEQLCSNMNYDKKEYVYEDATIETEDYDGSGFSFIDEFRCEN